MNHHQEENDLKRDMLKAALWYRKNRSLFDFITTCQTAACLINDDGYREFVEAEFDEKDLDGVERELGWI